MARVLKAIIWVGGQIYALLPRRISWLLGQGLGLFIYAILPVRKNVARANLARAFPEMSSSARRQILKRCYRHFGVALLDILAIDGWARRPEAIAVLDTTTLETARDQGQGLVLVSGHLGNWEMIILALGRAGYPLVPVVKIQRGIGETIASGLREATLTQTISRHTSARKMLRLLRDGKFLGLAGDQEALGKGTWVIFFGQPSSRFKGAATFHLSSGEPLYFVRCLLGKDLRYHIDLIPVKVDDLSGDREQDIQLLTQRHMDILETEVREHPGQYFWFHRLWKSIPPQ